MECAQIDVISLSVLPWKVMRSLREVEAHVPSASTYNEIMEARKETGVFKSKATWSFFCNSYGGPDYIPEPWAKSGF